MSSIFLWIFVIEIEMVLLVVLGIKNESRMMAFEKKVWAAIRKAVGK